jgi:hypothetical protein
MSRVSVEGYRKDGLIHLEVEGCIVNIHQGLKDSLGRKVTSVEIIPDDHYAGERPWKLRGARNNRLVQLKKVLWAKGPKCPICPRMW